MRALQEASADTHAPDPMTTATAPQRSRLDSIPHALDASRGRMRVMPGLLPGVMSLMALGALGCGGPGGSRPAEAQAEEALPAAATFVRLPPSQPYYVAGETMSFELSYGGILTGRAVMAVGQPGQIEGRPILIVRSLFETAGAAKLLSAFRDNVDTQIDWATGAPVEHRARAENAERRVHAFTRFEGQRTLIEFQREGKRKLEFVVTLPEGEVMHDMHSILGALRAWEPVPGSVLYFYSVSGRRVWRTELALRGSETTRTAMGLRAALRFEGVSRLLEHRTLEPDPGKEPRGMSLWLSDDAHRMPLRVIAHTEYGKFQAELVSYQSPSQPVSLR